MWTLLLAFCVALGILQMVRPVCPPLASTLACEVQMILRLLAAAAAAAAAAVAAAVAAGRALALEVPVLQAPPAPAAAAAALYQHPAAEVTTQLLPALSEHGWAWSLSPS
eukprot:464897-Pelagomonas_calceolata.AAC.8